MIKAMQQCEDFSLILFSGIKTAIISEEDIESICIDWLYLNTKMDDTTEFHVCKEGDFWCGMVEINQTMSIGFIFNTGYIRFILLPPDPDMKRISKEDWSDIWLYDIRVQTSVALLIKLIKDKYPHIVGICKKSSSSL